MTEPNQADQEKIEVEDLLRLKRSERPSETFWGEFDQDLHRRMLRTLVKKDPWYLQILRGLSGRLAQTTIAGGAAALLAFSLIQPALVDSTAPTALKAVASTQATSEGGSETSMAASSNSAPTALGSAYQSPEDVSVENLAREYSLDTIVAVGDAAELGYTADYSHDSVEIVGYDRGAFAMDSASFAGSGLATGLVY